MSMQYRPFGKLGIEVSALGFGAMRLPTGEDKSIDEAQSIRMIRHAIDSGVNYLDTAYRYHNGNSEIVVGKALKGGYRERIYLATKMPVSQVEKYEDLDRILDEQLQKLGTDHIDFYLLHGLRGPVWEKVHEMGVLKWAESARASGKIKYLGFSFHDSPDIFKKIVDAHDRWDFCQIQYNYMDETSATQAGREGLEYAAARGLGVVVMEPLLGGSLVAPPDEIQAIWDSSPVKKSPAEWAFDWVWSHPQVSTVLSGMSNFSQVEQNIESASRSGVAMLVAEELALVQKAKARYDELRPIPCGQCNYCMPCPNGVDIPLMFTLFNRGFMYNRMDEARNRYSFPDPAKLAQNCLECGECEPKCPQHINISHWMPYVHEVLGEKKPFDPAYGKTL